jgi:hypothetical protein
MDSHQATEQQAEFVSRLKDDDSPIARLVNALLVSAFDAGAEQMDLLPLPDQVLVRTNGSETGLPQSLQEMGLPMLPKHLQPYLFGRLRVMARLDPLFRGAILKGYLDCIHGQRCVGVTVTLAPTDDGREETVMLRFRDEGEVHQGA